METIKKEPTTTDKTNELVEKIKTAVNTCQLISEDCMVSLIFKNNEFDVIKEVDEFFKKGFYNEPSASLPYHSYTFWFGKVTVLITTKELKAKTVYE